jgi:L-seryl-tRNA(Ser) seleniumtransferase
VINLTGTVIHTNLGRAVLSEEVIASVADAMRSYNALEFDLEHGERGDRDTVVEALICRLTGAQAATVVNNCAAAVLLSLVALGARREVIISRSEQIEIGGSFRMPDIMKAANCRLVEVGTTNRTHLRDYQEAIKEKTALIVKAHRSNYAVTGFTAEVGDEELAALAHAHGLFYMVDLGSGALLDMSRWGLPREPLPSDALSKGADVVMFSGDKLLGGPQAGLIVGSRAAIDKIKKHPLKRTFRVSKLVMAALEATLRLYDSDHDLVNRLPVLAMLTREREDIRQACARVMPRLAQIAGPRFQADIVDCASQIGSGALPEERLPSAAVRLRPIDTGKRTGRLLSETLAEFRKLKTPVIGRIRDDAIVFDCRCLSARDESILLSAAS